MNLIDRATALAFHMKECREHDEVDAETVDRLARLASAAGELAESAQEMAEILDHCTFEVIRIKGQYVSRKDVVAIAYARSARFRAIAEGRE
jgi:hypothetical protein